MLAGTTRTSPLSDRDALRIATDAYNHHHASQKIPELAEAVKRVADIKPKVIVEIGCDAGGTLYCWSQLAETVIGVTLFENTLETGGQGTGYKLNAHGASVIYGDSHDPRIRSELRTMLPGPIDVLHIDGDHSYRGVKADFDDYTPLVRDGGVVLIHDAANTHDDRVAVPEFCADYGITDIIAGPGRPLGFGIWKKENHANR